MKIWNHFFNRSVGASAAPASPTLSPDNNRAAVITGPPANESGDEFCRRFAGQPYFQAACFRPSGFYVDRMPTLSEGVWKAVFNRAGGEKMLAKADREKLADLKAKQDELNAQLAEVSFWKSSSMLRGFQAKAVGQLLDGKTPPHIPGHAEVVSSIVATREGLHQAQRNLAPAIFEHIKAICDKMRDAARALTIEQDKNERENYGSFFGSEKPFQPSAQLIALAYIALGGIDQATRNFRLTGLISAPDPDGLLRLWWNPAAPVHKPVTVVRETSRRDFEKEAREAATQARNEQRESLNEMVAKVRTQSTASIEAQKDAKAVREAEAELRRQQAFDQLHTKP